jgi:hypothetical protein
MDVLIDLKHTYISPKAKKGETELIVKTAVFFPEEPANWFESFWRFLTLPAMEPTGTCGFQF